MPTGGYTDSVRAVPQLTVAGAYAAGDCVGGLLQFPNAVRNHRFSGVLQTVVLTDLAKQNQPFDLLLFQSDPDLTVFTDNSPLDVADAEVSLVIGHVPLTVLDYCALVDNSIATRAGEGLAIRLAGTSLFAALINRGSPGGSYAAGDLSIVITVLQD